MKLDEEEPIFQRQKVKLTPPDKIRFLAVCSDFLVLSVQSLKLLRVDLQAPEKLEGGFLICVYFFCFKILSYLVVSIR